MCMNVTGVCDGVFSPSEYKERKFYCVKGAHPMVLLSVMG